MSQPASFPELLAEVADTVRLRAVCDRCQGTGRDEVDFGCAACGGSLTASGSGLNPRYAALRDVLLEECPCLQGCPHDCSKCCPTWPTKPFSHTQDCITCKGTGHIPRRVWWELRRQGIKDALAGALLVFSELVNTDLDIAALEVVKEAMNEA